MITAHHLVFGRKYTNPFIAVINTNNISSGSSPANQFTLPLGINSNFTIDWGDGSIQTVITTASSVNHVYSNAGQYIIKILGNFRIGNFTYSNDRLKILEILQWGTCILSGGRFVGCSNLTLNNVSDVPNIAVNTSLQSLFEGCSSLTYINNLNNWDFTNVTSLYLMVTQCANFNQEINFKNTFNISNAREMFWLSSNFNSNINIDISNVLTLYGFLSGATNFNKDISHLNFNKNVILQNFMAGKTSANYNASYYDALLQKWATTFIGTGRTQTNKNLGMGAIKYTSVGKPYRDQLVADGWVITDGGMV